MIACVDLRGLAGAAPLRRARALGELAALAAAHPAAVLEAIAEDEDAFAARLVVPPGIPVVRRLPAATGRRVWRAGGEANPAPLDDAPTLVEPLDLGRLVDAEEGPADQDRALELRLRACAAADQVTWRVAAGWQSAVLRRRLGVPGARIVSLPAEAWLPAPERLASQRLPPGLPARYLLCLTPVGPAGDAAALIAAHARLGRDAAPLVFLGVDDECWIPAVRRAVESAGSRGRVLVLRDLDPVSQAVAIARAGAVVAVDRHPAHAVRVRQAATLGRPAVLRRHPGHAEWVAGGRWFDDGTGELADGLARPEPIAPAQAVAAHNCGPAAWLLG